MPRIFDLIAVVAVAVALLLPKPSLKASPALAGERIELDRVAALEDARFAAPDDVEVALGLADAYLRLGHADWALATLAAPARRPDADARVYLTRATAFAERLEAQATVDEAKRGDAVCDAAPARCPPGTRVKLSVIASSMQVLLDGKIDPYKDPQRAREAVSKVLHATHAKGAPPARP
jgi:hypothetical protein